MFLGVQDTHVEIVDYLGQLGGRDMIGSLEDQQIDCLDEGVLLFAFFDVLIDKSCWDESAVLFVGFRSGHVDDVMEE